MSIFLNVAQRLAMGSSGFWSELLSGRTDGLIKTVTVHEPEAPLLPIGVVSKRFFIQSPIIGKMNIRIINTVENI